MVQRVCVCVCVCVCVVTRASGMWTPEVQGHNQLPDSAVGYGNAMPGCVCP